MPPYLLLFSETPSLFLHRRSASPAISFSLMTKPRNRRLRSFSRPERRKLQKLLEEGGGELFEEKFYQELTDEFNRAEATNDRVKIEVEQVRRWFCSRKGDHVGKPVSAPIDSMELASLSDSTSGSKELVSSPNSLPGSSKELIVAPDPKVSNNAPESTADTAKGKKVEKEEWEFEARSSREGAWYDVADFLAYRNNGVGLHEAHVRFQDFGAEEDEWVDLLKAVRVRSIPLESSDCPRVAVGDLVLCFRESKDRAAYYDAHIMEIERRQHDIRGCRCRFSVKFDLNEVEKIVGMKDLCRRPVMRSEDVVTSDNKSKGSEQSGVEAQEGL